MKERPELRLPRKRSRSGVKEEESKKRPVTTEELQKLKKFDRFVERLISTIDPFTVDAFELTSSQISEKALLGQVDQEYLDLFYEYITEPQKQKKSNAQSEFLECKKRFGLLLNREDPEQDSLLSARFSLYSESLAVPESTSDMLSFLSSLPKPGSSGDRKQCFKQAIDLASASVAKLAPEVPEKTFVGRLVEFDPPPALSLSPQEKLCLLRALAKHAGDWEKIAKEFKDKPTISVDLLKKIWRCLKISMKEEVSEIKKKAPQFHHIKWLRAAVRKLELSIGKKSKNKNLACVNPKPKEQRLDMLSVMAEAESLKCSGIVSSTSLNISQNSSFKAYANGGIVLGCTGN